MNRVVHFEIQVDNVERAKNFYTTIFGWSIERYGEMDYWGIMTAPKDSPIPGINGGLLKRPCPAPGLEQGTNAFVCTIQVDDIDSMITSIEQHGGKIAMPKFALPGMAWQAYCIDTEGNIFGLHQLDPNAK